MAQTKRFCHDVLDHIGINYKKKTVFIIPGSSLPLLVLETPILENQETGEGRYNGETDLLRTL